MKMTGSPAIWTVSTAVGYPWHVQDQCGDTVCRIGGHFNAILDDETNESNARLIAAAPKMYEWLKRMAPSWDAEAAAIVAEVEG